MNQKDKARIDAILKRDRLPRKPIGKAVQKRIRDLKLSRAEAALRVNDAASQMSRLMTDHFDEFSADRMVGFLLDLGCNVQLTIGMPSSTRRGKVRVTAFAGKQVIG